MDRDRIEGAVKTLTGRAKEFFGWLVGNSKTENKGKLDQAEGKVQNSVGGIKDAVREGEQGRRP